MALDTLQIFDFTEGLDFEAKKAAGKKLSGLVPNPTILHATLIPAGLLCERYEQPDNARFF